MRLMAEVDLCQLKVQLGWVEHFHCHQLQPHLMLARISWAGAMAAPATPLALLTQ
jgi:hypothetical protein